MIAWFDEKYFVVLKPNRPKKNIRRYFGMPFWCRKPVSVDSIGWNTVPDWIRIWNCINKSKLMPWCTYLDEIRPRFCRFRGFEMSQQFHLCHRRAGSGFLFSEYWNVEDIQKAVNFLAFHRWNKSNIRHRFLKLNSTGYKIRNFPITYLVFCFAD